MDLDATRSFGGMDRLYGVPAADAIRRAHVVVVGLGGVGSWCAEALARSGIGRITLIDIDHVAESNINRQIQALTTTVGQAKVQAMKERMALINPGCVVECVEEFVEPGNWPALLGPGVMPDAVIDACDQVKAKVALAVWSQNYRVPFVSVGAAGGKRLAHKVDVDDLSQVTHDPLLAQLRYSLRKFHAAPREGKKMGVVCVFSREAVAPPDPSCAIEGDGSLNCHGYGSVVTVTATFGLCAVSAILNFLSVAFLNTKK